MFAENQYDPKYNPMDPTITEYEYEELNDSFGIVQDIDEWCKIVTNQNLDYSSTVYNSESFQIDLSKVVGLHSCFCKAAAEYIVNNFNVKGFMAQPACLLNGRTTLLKYFALNSIDDLEKYISKSDEIYLRDVVHILTVFDYKKDTNELIETQPQFKFKVGFGVIN